MNGRVIIKAMPGKESAFSQWIDWLFLGTVVCGLLLFFRAAGGLSFPILAACLPVLGTCGLLWGAHCLGRGWLAGCSLLLAAAAAGWFLLSEGLRSQLWQVLRSLSGGAGQGVEAATAAIFLAVVLTLAAFLLEAACRMHWPLFLLTTFLMLSAPVFGVSLDAAAVFLFLLFQMVFWTLQGMERAPASDGTSVWKRPGRWLRCFLLLVVAGAFSLSWLAVSWQGDAFYQAAYTAEGYVQWAVKQASGIVDEPDSGRLNRGNLYPAGTEQLELVSNVQPTETVYLKGFSGGEYQDGVWLPADDNTVYQRMDENTLHWGGRWDSWIAGMVDTMPFVMNRSTRSAQQLPDRELEVWQSGDEEERYVPYFSTRGRGTREINEEGQAGYLYEYYELQELQIDWDQVSRGQEMLADWYQAIHFAYLAEADDFYTGVPEEDLPRLARLCRENPQDSVEEITAFIITTLQDTAAYTRTPGLFPMNEDPVEYFLFDNRQGYCQHFASAAVLMYRMYGIPARYATGYAASPSDFSEQPDGSYRAVLTDASAHAWPEIFLENYGWVPVEVTPSGYDTAASYSGMDSALLEDLLAERQGSSAIPKEEESPAGRETTEEAQGTLLSLPDGEALATGGVLLLLFAAAALVIYRSSRLRAQERMGIRQLFARLVDALHAAGLLADCDGSEPDFPSRLSEAVAGLSVQEAERLCRLAERAAFSAAEPGAEETAEFQRLYSRVIHLLFCRLPWWRKLYFRYWKNFC